MQKTRRRKTEVRRQNVFSEIGDTLEKAEIILHSNCLRV